MQGCVQHGIGTDHACGCILTRTSPCEHLAEACALAGNNQLKRLDNVMYLRQFRNLRLVNLAGNPFCKEHDYRSYVLSHIKDLTYLDYRRVVNADVSLAMEQHQVRVRVCVCVCACVIGRLRTGLCTRVGAGAVKR